MPATHIEIANFSAFKKLTADFSPGLNVFIGENATGKSHLMKLIYSVLKAMEQSRANGLEDSKQALQLGLRTKLAGVFKPEKDRLGRLVNRSVGRRSAKVKLACGQIGEVSFFLSNLGRLRLTSKASPPAPRSIFLPAHEALAMYEGFISAYENRELSFDETYFDLCKSLSGTPLRGPRGRKAGALIKPLEEILGGRVALGGGRFYLHSRAGLGNFEAQLLAEGHRKIASVAHLIANGSLMRNAVLFWDEPEANLNPRLITKVAQLLRSLAAAGVQVFIATHDYLLSYELALAAEYRTKPVVPMRFFAFTREAPSLAVGVEASDDLPDLKNNPILQEFADHYDREQRLFHGAALATGGRE